MINLPIIYYCTDSNIQETIRGKVQEYDFPSFHFPSNRYSMAEIVSMEYLYILQSLSSHSLKGKVIGTVSSLQREERGKLWHTLYVKHKKVSLVLILNL